MKVKNYLLLGTLALSLGTASIASAHPMKHHHQRPTHCHKEPHFLKMLTQEQRTEFDALMTATKEQVKPLFKEKHALHMQLNGLIATPGMQWSEVSKVVDKINANNAKITTLFAQNKLEVFKKFGVVLPPFHRAHAHV